MPPPGTSLRGRTESADLKFTVAQEERFARLYAENFPWAIRVATRFGVLDPEIVVVEALCRAMVRHDPARGEFKPFFRRILFWDLARAYRREVNQRSRTVPLSPDFEVPDEASLAHVILLEVRDLLEVALTGLPAAQQQLFWLIYEGLSLKEIAARL